MQVMPESEPIIELTGAGFGYTDRRVVSDVDLTVHSGEVVALLGPNGSGKSTLVRGLLGLVDQEGGSARLFGIPRDQFTEHTRIGYVPQRHSLSSSVRATVTEIVEVGRLPHRPWWKPQGREDREVVRESIRAVGLVDRANEEVASLSGGQQRRVLIARALAGRPEVLVMDEPTAGVDLPNQQVLADTLTHDEVDLAEGLSRLAAEGTSMIVVTHELEALADVVTRIVCMDAGHLDFDGSPGAYAAHVASHSTGSSHHHEREGLSGPGAVLGSAPLDRTSGRPS